MRRTKALILVATLAVLTSVAACSWQAEPLPAESAQSESSLSISEFATQETAEEEQQIGFYTKKHATTTFVQMIFSGSDTPCCE